MEREYKAMFDEVHASDKLRQEVMNMTKQEKHKVLRKISRTTLIAAILAAALAGTALAASILGGTLILLGRSEEKDGVQQEVITGGVLIPEDGGEPIALSPKEAAQMAAEEPPKTASEGQSDRAAPDTIQGWHEAEWEKQNQQETMSEEQKQVIESLTYSVGASDISNGVIATVDSVTVGNSNLWVLLKFKGEFELEHELRRHLFGDSEIHLYTSMGKEPETRVLGYFGGHTSLDSQGNLTTMLNIYADFMDPEVSLRNGCTVELRFTNLMDGEELLQDGTWTLRFDLDPIEQEEKVLSVDSAEVAYLYKPPIDNETPATVLPDGREIYHRSDSDNEERFTTIRNIRVSASGVRFIVDDDSIDLNVDSLILADGTEIGTAVGAHANSMGDALEWVYYWASPVDVNEAAALRVQDMVIPLK